MPDGDVFGEGMDGCWKEAAQLLENGADNETVFEALVRGLEKWRNQWLPDGPDSLMPCAEVICRIITLRDSDDQLKAALSEIARLTKTGPYIKHIIREAARGLCVDNASWIGMDAGYVVCRLYSETLRLAVTDGFIDPAVRGGLRVQHFSPTQARTWKAVIEHRVAEVVAAVEQKPYSKSFRRLLQFPRQKRHSTIEFLDMTVI